MIMVSIQLAKPRFDKIISTRENFEAALKIYERKSTELRNIRPAGSAAAIDAATRELISAGDQLIAWSKLYAEATESILAMEVVA